MIQYTKRKFISGLGPPNAKIAIFGEAPGEEEEKYGKPFIGKAGRLLTNVLSEMGLPRSTIYIDNVIPIRPPDNQLSRLPELGYSKESFYPGARKRLKEINPDVAILLGNEPLMCFLQLDNITKRRGSVYEWEGIKIVPSLHPSGILRSNKRSDLYLLEFDLRKAKGLVGSGKVWKDRAYIIDPTYDTVMEHLTRLKEAQFLSVDIETVRYNTIDCIGFSDSDDLIISVPFLTRKGPRWMPEEEKLIWEAVMEVMAAPSLKIIQNAMYELFFFYFYGIPVTNLWMDTMLAFHCIYPELKKALWSIQSLYTNEPYHKDEGREADTDEDRWVYNCKDVGVTFECAMGLLEDLRASKLDHFFFHHIMREVKPYMAMSTRGIRIDVQKWEELRRLTKEELIVCQHELDEKVGAPLNVKSFKQMKEYFYIEKGLTPITKKKKITLSEDALWQLYAKYPNEGALTDVIHVRNRRTFIELFLNKEWDQDGRLRSGYNVAGTVTGRSSSSECPFGTGLNIQQTPRPGEEPERIWKHFREVFVADPGMIFVACDLAQAEARVVAWICNDEVEKGMYARGESVHVRNASICTNQPVEDCRKGTEAYNLGKASKHAYNYNIGPVQLFREIVKNYGRAERPLPERFSIASCKQILSRFDEYSPLIKEIFHRYIIGEIKKSRVLYSPFGRRRLMMGGGIEYSWTDELFRSGHATVPQSTVVDIIHRAMYSIYPELPDYFYLVFQAHDGYGIQCPNNEVAIEEAKRLMRKWTEIDILINGDVMRIPVEFKVGKNLGEV